MKWIDAFVCGYMPHSLPFRFFARNNKVFNPKLFETRVLLNIFGFKFSNKCSCFEPSCLPAKMASETVIRTIELKQYLVTWATCVPTAPLFAAKTPAVKPTKPWGWVTAKPLQVYVFHNHSCSNTCSSHPSCSICRLLAEHLRKVDKYMTNIIVLPVDHSWAQHGEYPLICGFSLFKTLLRKEKGLITLVKFSYYDPADCNRLTTSDWLRLTQRLLGACVGLWIG